MWVIPLVRSSLNQTPCCTRIRGVRRGNRTEYGYGVWPYEGRIGIGMHIHLPHTHGMMQRETTRAAMYGYFVFWPFFSSCDRTDAASVRVCAAVGLVRPARTFEARDETFGEVCLVGGLVISGPY